MGRTAPARARLNRTRAFGTATLVAIVLTLATRAAAVDPVAAPITGGAPTVDLSRGRRVARRRRPDDRADRLQRRPRRLSHVPHGRPLPVLRHRRRVSGRRHAVTEWVDGLLRARRLRADRAHHDPSGLRVPGRGRRRRAARARRDGDRAAPVVRRRRRRSARRRRSSGSGGEALARHGPRARGEVTTAPCTGGISNETSICWDYRNVGANTCQGDSAGRCSSISAQGRSSRARRRLRVSCIERSQLRREYVVYRLDRDGRGRRSQATAAAASAGRRGRHGRDGGHGRPGLDSPFALESVGVAPGVELRVALLGRSHRCRLQSLRAGGAAWRRTSSTARGRLGQYASAASRTPAQDRGSCAPRRPRQGRLPARRDDRRRAASVCSNGLRRRREVRRADTEPPPAAMRAAIASCARHGPRRPRDRRHAAPLPAGDDRRRHRHVHHRRPGERGRHDRAHRRHARRADRDPPRDAGPREPAPRVRWRGDQARGEEARIPIRKKAPTEWAIRLQGRNVQVRARSTTRRSSSRADRHARAGVVSTAKRSRVPAPGPRIGRRDAR